MRVLFYLLLALGAASCGFREQKLFRLIDAQESNITFSNDLTFDPAFNIFKYRNYYNGGGVGLIDYNNDGLQDIYLVANMSKNRLYENKGNFKFEDVTEAAQVGGIRAWSTGVAIADVNGDGWMDIYVCNSGDVQGDDKKNELFINNTDGTFTEMAAQFGLANQGFSIHASFFDYDKDNDLDMYLVNNSYKAIGSFNLMDNERWERDPRGGDKLYRNDNGTFVDVTEQSGIYASVIGFGLGVTVADINNDGWLDIYISNDFFERDYLYYNNQKGGFTEKLEDQIKSISAAAMGADIGDLDNDGHMEIFVTDMLPPTNERLKTVTTFDSWERYIFSVENGYWHQFTRNVLQYNNGDSTFSEIGRYAGVEASDWSWAPIIFDFQNDGYKDIFISNGINQDLTNQDFLQFVTKDQILRKITAGGQVDYKTLISYIPSVPIPNHAYVNNGNLTFSNMSEEMGLSDDSFSNGTAYGDLDNDGDLDIVINNTNMQMFLYENLSENVHPENHYLRFVLKGEGGNTGALGTRISAFADGKSYILDHLPTRGFQSAIDYRPLLGVGKYDSIDVEVRWPSGKITRLPNIATNQELTLHEADAVMKTPEPVESPQSLFVEMDSMAFHARHVENSFNDFERDRLLFEMASTQGPCLCSGDINNDGLEDIFIGGAKGFRGGIYGQNPDGDFIKIDVPVFDRTTQSEDIDCALFDANGDGNLDLYVATGGNEFNPAAASLNDRLYFGKGNYQFDLVRQSLPAGKLESSSVVEPCDFDQDGDADLFVGIRLRSFFYGEPCNGYILENDGKGNFTNISLEVAPDLSNIGMITDAKWADLDKDNDYDLIVVGKWMPISIFINNSGTFSLDQSVLPNTNGWWNTIEAADVNGDSIPDILVGNHGLNSRFRASIEKPIHMYVKDFDRNGTMEQIICQYEGNKLFPLPLKHDLAGQIPHMGARYPRYENYMFEEITDIFNKNELLDAIDLHSQDLSTSVFLSKDVLEYAKVELPMQVQFSSIFAILVNDFNNDSNPDILFAGNMYESKPEVGIYDANYGTLTLGDGEGNFELLPVLRSGLKIDKATRKICAVETPYGLRIVVANNNERAQVFRKNAEASDF
jgi:hypothetical protein